MSLGIFGVKVNNEAVGEERLVKIAVSETQVGAVVMYQPVVRFQLVGPIEIFQRLLRLFH